MAMAIVSQDQNIHVVPDFDGLDTRNVVVPLTMLTCHVMPTSVSMACHDQKSHVAAYFNHLDLTNAMVPLAMSSGSHAVYVKASGST